MRILQLSLLVMSISIAMGCGARVEDGVPSSTAPVAPPNDSPPSASPPTPEPLPADRSVCIESLAKASMPTSVPEYWEVCKARDGEPAQWPKTTAEVLAALAGRYMACDRDSSLTIDHDFEELVVEADGSFRGTLRGATVIRGTMGVRRRPGVDDVVRWVVDMKIEGGKELSERELNS